MNYTHQKAKLAEMKVTGQRFCTNCQRYKPLEGGRMKVTGSRNTKRWQCETCALKLRDLEGKR